MGKGRKLFGSGVSIDHSNENNLGRKVLLPLYGNLTMGSRNRREKMSYELNDFNPGIK